LKFALDATYSLGSNLSGVGVYSREILHGLARAHAEARFLWCYRPHRWLRSVRESAAPNVRRRLLLDAVPLLRADLFHGLNQRLPRTGFRRRISTFHDLFVLTGQYSTAEFRARFAAQARDAASASDLIIAVSHFTASQVRGLLGVEPSRLRVVHHGVRPAFPDSPPARENIVLHVGAIQARKNVARLVNAFASMPADWRLVLAGSAGYGADSIFAQIAASPASTRIQVTGWLPDRELDRCYAQARIFAFPSMDEGFGLPVLEAMSRGVPVLTSNRSALPEVADGAALLVDPENEEEIASGLRRLAADESLRAELKKRGLERAALFTWELAVERTWDVYQELL
jgi:glycosyltransferase involved in cell wall biosynthesis